MLNISADNAIYNIIVSFIWGIIFGIITAIFTFILSSLINALFIWSKSEQSFDEFVRFQIISLVIAGIIILITSFGLILRFQNELTQLLGHFGVIPDISNNYIVLSGIFIVNLVMIIVVSTTLKIDEKKFDEGDYGMQSNVGKFFSGSVHGNPISPLFEIMFQSFNAKNENTLNSVANSLESIRNSQQSFRGFMDYMRKTTLSNLQGVWNGIESQFQGVQKLVQSMLNIIIDSYDIFINMITSLEYFVDIFTPAIDEITKVNKLTNEVKGAFDVFKTDINKAVGAVRNTVEGVERKVEGVIDEVKNFGKSTAKKAGRFLKKLEFWRCFNPDQIVNGKKMRYFEIGDIFFDKKGQPHMITTKMFYDRSIQRTDYLVNVDGIWMTPDHKVWDPKTKEIVPAGFLGKVDYNDPMCNPRELVCFETNTGWLPLDNVLCYDYFDGIQKSLKHQYWNTMMQYITSEYENIPKCHDNTNPGFSGGTLIDTIDGRKQIKDIQLYDKLKDGQIVVGIIHSWDRTWWSHLSFSNDIIKCTPSTILFDKKLKFADSLRNTNIDKRPSKQIIYHLVTTNHIIPVSGVKFVDWEGTNDSLLEYNYSLIPTIKNPT